MLSRKEKEQLLNGFKRLDWITTGELKSKSGKKKQSKASNKKSRKW